MFQDITPFVLALIITFTVLICISIWNSMNRELPPQKGTQTKDGPSRTREILLRFSQFYNNLSPEAGYIFDTAILPDPKQHIIHALYVGYDESETDEDKDAIKRGLEAIICFQELVGEEPLKPILKDEDTDYNISTEQLFLDQDSDQKIVSDEEKKYTDFETKKIIELEEHFKHLKIVNDEETVTRVSE